MKKPEYKALEASIQTAMPKLAKHQLNGLRKLFLDEIKKRYSHSQAPRYGTLDRGFTQEEMDRLFSKVENPRARTILWIMASLGLRIGEACSIKAEHVDLANKRIWVLSEKNSTPTLLPLHDQVYPVLAQWMEQHKATIQRTGYIFPPNANDGNPNKYPYTSPNWVRKVFREARTAAGLDFSYGDTSESRPGRKNHRLYRLTTHSLRHGFGHKVFESTKDILLTQKALRHRKIDTTMIYTHKSQAAVDRALYATFGQQEPQSAEKPTKPAPKEPDPRVSRICALVPRYTPEQVKKHLNAYAKLSEQNLVHGAIESSQKNKEAYQFALALADRIAAEPHPKQVWAELCIWKGVRA